MHTQTAQAAQATPPAALHAAHHAPAANLPNLATIEETAAAFPRAHLTPAAIRALVFRADDRRNSRGDLLPGNGLGRRGAIVRIGRKVLIDLDRFADWLNSHRIAA